MKCSSVLPGLPEVDVSQRLRQLTLELLLRVVLLVEVLFHHLELVLKVLHLANHVDPLLQVGRKEG